MKKIFRVLNFRQKLTAIFVINLILLTSFLEVLVLFFIQPLLQLFLNIKTTSYNVNFFFSDTNISGKLLIVLFAICIISRNVSYATTSFFKNSFVKNLHINISNSIYSSYLNRNYIFFLRNSSSKLISNITTEIDNFCYRVIDCFFIFLTEVFLLCAITLFLFLKFFQFSLILVLFCSLLFLLSAYTFKRKLKRIGLEKSIADKNKINNLQNSFYAIQSIKLDNIENFFVKKFSDNNAISSKKFSYLNTFNDLLKPIWELTVLISFSVTVYIGYNFFDLFRDDIVLILGTFAVAIFRFLPSLNRLLNSFNTFKFFSNSIEFIHHEFSNSRSCTIIDNIRNENCPETYKQIELKNISFNYEKNTPVVLDEINLIIKNNSINFIKGESGSGKSTLLNILCGLLSPTNGEVLVDKKNINSFLRSYQSKIGYVPQKTLLIDDTILENIIFGHNYKNYDLNLIKKVINQSKLNKLINKLPLGLNSIVGERGASLSGGEQQRVGIARALYKNPKILILDEATSALDKETESELLKEILKLDSGITIVVVSHKEIELNININSFELKNKKIIQLK
jgi:ABC-type multidrug transport system fused ATPase/permease subunit